MNGCFVGYIFYKHAFPMLMGEKAKLKELDALYKELSNRRIYAKKPVPYLKCNDRYKFVALTNERANDIMVGNGKSLVDEYRANGVTVQFPRAPCMILCNETSGELVLALIDQCLHLCACTD